MTATPPHACCATFTFSAEPASDKAMLREAVAMLVGCRKQGASQDEMVECFSVHHPRITEKFPSWSAKEKVLHCVDGSQVFIGDAGPAMAVLPDPDRTIGIGKYGDGEMVELWPTVFKDGHMRFPAPNLNKAGRRE